MSRFSSTQINKFYKISFKIILVSLLFFCASIFYYLSHIDETLKLSEISHYSNFGFSDLGRYNYAFDNDKDLSIIFSRGFDEKITYYTATAIISYFGISFKFFLLIIICFYFYTFVKIFHKLTLSKNYLIYVLLLILLSYWMQPLVTVALPQGVAFIFLIYFLYYKYKLSFLLKIFIIIFASTIHFSAIFLTPIIIFDKFFHRNIRILEFLFFLSFLLYITNQTFIFSEILIYFSETTSLDIGALSNKESAYAVGFSLLKFIALIIPIILFRLTDFEKFSSSILAKRIYSYYLYIGIIGMLLSNLPYHDRLLLYAWGVSPILITAFMYIFLIKISK